MIPLVNLKRQFTSLENEIMNEIKSVIRNGQYILGPKVRELEDKMADKLNIPFVITVANGTDALVLTLKAMGIGAGDEVITTPFTFFATAEAISRVGAKPVFVDIDPNTFNIDPLKIEEKISVSTKAIIPVHIFGQPADMTEIKAIAQKHSLAVIEDACQAFGSTYKGDPIGSLGDVACFSFFPTKNLGTIGDGGMIVTWNEKIANDVRKLRQHGSTKKYYHDCIGYNSRLDEIHAAVLLAALNHIDTWNSQRIKLAARYEQMLRHLPFLTLPQQAKNRTHIYHLYCIQTENRDALIDFLGQRDIQSGVYYPLPLHLQNAYQDLGYKLNDCPVSEELSHRIMAIPLYPLMTESEQDQVTQAIIEFGGAQ